MRCKKMDEKMLKKKFVEHMLENAEKKDVPKPYVSTQMNVNDIEKLTEELRKKQIRKK
jgi:hypothetical protein